MFVVSTWVLLLRFRTRGRYRSKRKRERPVCPHRNKGVEVGLLFVPVAQEAEGFKLSLELHWAAVELVNALQEK